MKVSLINYTTDAKYILVFSKNTRLNMDAGGFNKYKAMSEQEIDKELQYVFSTIGSSLEFVDYIFMIEGVTRAFTHQLVRHRVGVSFAQQSMRTVDMSNFEYYTPEGLAENEFYKDAMEGIQLAYKDMIWEGIKPEDARGILPTNILTNILMKINLRALSDMMGVRLCYRVQKEFRDVMLDIKKLVCEIHPFCESLMEVNCIKRKYCMFPRHDCPERIKNLGK